MNPQNRRGAIMLALLIGFAVLALLFPASVATSQPPVCRSMLGFVVPCEAWVAWTAAAGAAALVYLAVGAIFRRRG